MHVKYLITVETDGRWLATGVNIRQHAYGLSLDEAQDNFIHLATTQYADNSLVTCLAESREDIDQLYTREPCIMSEFSL